jgi:hypothetical protein
MSAAKNGALPTACSHIFRQHGFDFVVTMAQAIHAHVGNNECDDDQLAAWTDQSAKSSILPPTSALEREIVALGVSEKQKERARQVFERSAEQAGFSEHGKNRLVMPGVGAGGHRKLSEHKPLGGAGGNGGGPSDALIQALIEKLPPSGPWGADERMNWLKMLIMAFQVAYGTDEEIEVKKKEAAN